VKRRLQTLASRVHRALDDELAGWVKRAGEAIGLSSEDEVVAPCSLADLVQPAEGLVERAIELTAASKAGPPESTFQALKGYSIRDFGSGLPAAEAIVRHVLDRKLEGGRGVPDRIWSRTVALPITCSIRQAKTGRSFDAVAPRTVADVDEELARREPDRVRDIEAYAQAIRGGAALPPPIYVSGAVLNACSPRRRALPHGMYMLDGARRLAAHALAGSSSVRVVLVIDERQLSGMLPEADVRALRARLESLAWFSSYQTLPMLGLQGERTLRRFDLMDLDRLQDQLVLDFGCNVGLASAKAVQAGAREVVGVEGMPDTFALARDIGALVGFKRLRFAHVDFNDADFDKQIDAAVPERADYSFFFSVYRTKELKQRDRLFSYILDKTSKGVFFEGHAHATIDTLDYYAWLFESFGLSYRFLGHSEGKLRPMFFIDRRAR
jgi:SAM-dependent methyltransferase